MRDQILKGARILAAALPILAFATPMAAQRQGSWEFSLGGGFVRTDAALISMLGTEGFTSSGSSPNRIAPTLVARVGYNINNNVGFSVGIGQAGSSNVKYVTPFTALTYTWNLNARTSPFLTFGTQFTRITGNGMKTHPTWGTRLGLGFRHMMSPNVALRLEGRMGLEHYPDLPGAKSAYTSVLTLGLSYFTAGRKSPKASVVQAPCPMCERARVDTVWISPPPPPPPAPHVCARGVIPAGAPVDQYGCLILRDSLLLEQVHFDFDKSAITPTAIPILDRVAESMLAYPEAFFEIAGHTDSVGTFAYNFLLSARRAAAVRDYLIQQGVPAWKMSAVGYGEGFPIAPNATVDGRALNRRGLQIRTRRPS